MQLPAVAPPTVKPFRARSASIVLTAREREAYAAYDGYQTVERASKAWIASSRVTSRAPIDNAVA